MPVAILVTQDVPQRKLCNHFYGVGVEIMVQFARGDQDSVQQLLDLRIAGFGLIEDLASEVYWSLDLVHMLDLLVLHDDGYTDHPISCHDIKQQGFAFLGCCQDQRRCEKSLELYKRCISLLRPFELLLCLEELEKWQTLLSEL
jgi:hypothetical protein